MRGKVAKRLRKKATRRVLGQKYIDRKELKLLKKEYKRAKVC